MQSKTLPLRWLNCPRKGDLIEGIFIPFKTPLDKTFKNVPESNKFTVDMVFQAAKQYKRKIGLWIDLTNTNRFYNKKEVEDRGAEYHKIACRGFGEAPSKENVDSFIYKVASHLSKNSEDLIAVHCTHGYNRTGYMICAYLIHHMFWSPIAAVDTFANARPPGIYKQDYLNELFTQYDMEEDTPMAPFKPDWDLTTGPEDFAQEQEDDADDTNNMAITNGIHSTDNVAQDQNNLITNTDNTSLKQEMKPSHSTTLGKSDLFMDGQVLGVTQFTDKSELKKLRGTVKKLCEFNGNGFPGSQPVSMTIDNIHLLAQKPYKVSWKADGYRFMMYISSDGVYLIDRDNRYFKTTLLTFPMRKHPDKQYQNSLLDGEMVMDVLDGVNIPRYLIYDIIIFEGEQVGKTPFDTRMLCIEHEFINPRAKAIHENRINRSQEPFSIRMKQFFPLVEASKLWGTFQAKLSHGMDGLVFQPNNDPYKMGRWDELLKWKPPELNSIDFRLKIVKEVKYGMLPESKGYLYVGGHDKPVAQIKVTKEIKEYHDKIIECKYEDNQWVFMKHRTDKSFPNHISTAESVMYSIMHPVTSEILFNFIQQESYAVLSGHQSTKNLAPKPNGNNLDTTQQQSRPNNKRPYPND